MITNKTLRKKNLELNMLLLLITYLMITNMISFAVLIDWKLPVSIMVKSGIAIMGLIVIRSVFLLFKKRIHINNLVLLMFAISSLISTLLNYRLYRSDILNSVIYIFFWISIFLIFFESAKCKTELQAIDKLIYTFPIMYIIFLYSYFQYIQTTNVSGYNLIYYIIVFLPYVLNLKKDKYKYIGLILILFATLLSMKRLAIISLVLAFLIYSMIDNVVKGKMKRNLLKSITLSGVIITIGAFMYNYIVKQFGFDILYKIQNLTVDGGSGRIVIYDLVWQEILSSSFYEFAIGRGYNSVGLTGVANYSAAHNDFLEIIFNNGIFGFILYLLFWSTLISFNYRLIKKRSTLAASFSASLVIFFLLSIFSVLVIYPRYFIYLVIFWATCMGNEYRQKLLRITTEEEKR